MYLTAGNFPSIAANTIQVAKMASAYIDWLPNLEVIALSGPVALMRRKRVDIKHIFGLKKELKMRYSPLLLTKTSLLFDKKYLPPGWFYYLVGIYARLRGADLVFTRRPETAMITTYLNIDTILEMHCLWKDLPEKFKQSKIFLRPEFKAVIVVTEPIAESLIKEGVPGNKVMIEPDGVDIFQYTPMINKREARRRLNLPLDKFTCVYTGHLYRDRGIEYILKAAKLLPNMNFIIVGGWEKDVEYYKSMADGFKLKNVIFFGYVPHSKIPLFQFSADILLMQYSRRTSHAGLCSPIKLFEYMAAGRPIILPDLKVLKEIITHKKNGYIIKPDSMTGLVNAIKKISSQPSLSMSLGKNARKDSKRYEWKNRAKRILRRVLVV